MIIVRRIMVSMLLLLVAVSHSYSQIPEKKARILHLGVKGGIVFTSIAYNKPNSISETMNSYTGWSAGVALSIKMPLKGMTLQPEINYVDKGSKITGYDIHDRNPMRLSSRMSYLEMPINFQYGLDLVLFRPFLMVSPYIGYAISQNWTSSAGDVPFGWDNLNRFEYGIGVGGGVDFWRIQLQVRYNWNLGKLISNVPQSGIIDTVTYQIFKSIDNGNFRGLDVSVTFFF